MAIKPITTASLTIAATLATACTPAPSPVPVNPWIAVEPNLIRNRCAAEEEPVREPHGFFSCTALEEEDAKRYGAHRLLVFEKRAEAGAE